MLRMRLVLLLVALAGLLPGAARADTWPAKPVRVIVPYAAGGSSDALARPWAEKLSQALGQQFVIDNKGGASGTIGAEAMVRSTADGYTLLAAPNSALLLVPQLRKVPYDGQRDFQPVARMGDMTAGLAIHPSVPANTLKELYAYAAAHPDELTCGSAGLGTSTHLRCERIAANGGVKIRHIPYRGNAETLNDLLAGHISMTTEIVIFPQVKAGKLKMLAILDDQRHPDFPDVPTFEEAGGGKLDVPIWYGMFAPKGTPPEIVAQLGRSMREIGRTADMKARLQTIGFRPPEMTPEEMSAQMAEEWTTTQKMVKSLDIRLD